MKNVAKTNTNLPSKDIQEGLKLASKYIIDMLGVSGHSEISYAIQQISNNNDLKMCSVDSVVGAIIDVNRLGLTLSPSLKLCYLINKDGRCSFDITYMGLISILKDTKSCKYIDAFLVYEDEEFLFSPSTGSVVHKPRYAKTEQEQKSREIVGVYSRAVLPTDDTVFCFMPMWEINKVKDLTKGSSNKNSFWNLWTEEMIKKTVIKRHFKTLVVNNISTYNLKRLSETFEYENTNNEMVTTPKSKSKGGLFDLNFDEQ